MTNAQIITLCAKAAAERIGEPWAIETMEKITRAVLTRLSELPVMTDEIRAVHEGTRPEMFEAMQDDVQSILRIIVGLEA